MSDVEPDALADVAYGLFELMLNQELRAGGEALYLLVEGHIDFRVRFDQIFDRFSEEYPQLAEALLSRFSDTDTIYGLIRAGEGVTPSMTTQMYWIVQDAPGVDPEAIQDELAGKWLIFLPPEEVDDAWRKVRDSTWRGELGISAKVSTAKPNPDSRDNMKVIYVYTPDWRDEEDVMRVRERLRELGFVDRLGYKRNIETFQGQYSQKGKKVTFYSA
jgi:hypothetical protein